MIIKKIGVIIFSLIFVTTLSLIPVKADEIVSTDIDTYSPTLTEEENKQIIGAKYLVEYLRQGGSIDLTNKSSGYTAIDLIDDIADFFNGTLAEFLGDEGYWINNISETQVPTYINLKEPKITSDVNMMLGLLPFMETNEVPVPTPDVNYVQYINYINTQQNNILYFFWKNYNTYEIPYNSIYDNVVQTYPYSSYTWYTSDDFSLSSSTNKLVVACDKIYDINIFSNNGIYSFTQSINIFQNNIFSEVSNSYMSRWLRFYPNNDNVDFYSRSFPTNVNLSYTGTLEQVFQYIQKYVKNVNIYVDGVLWSYVGGTNTHINLGQGTYIDNTNQPIQYDYPEPTKIDLTDLIDRLDLLIENQNKIKFPDFSDLIVDENGQQAVAVVVVNKDLTIDDWYVTNYGTLIPLFPVFVDFPVSMTDITTIATVGIKDVIPIDILEILGIGLVGMLFVTWIHRLLE